MANEIILVGDVHANETKVIYWQLKCQQLRNYRPIVNIPYLMIGGDTFPRMSDVDFSKAVEAMDKLAKLVK